MYATPVFPGYGLGYIRLGGGVGLGNMLFPWARFVVGCREHSLTPVYPTWPQIKSGPILRGEVDKRFYLGLFRPRPGEVVGLARLKVLTMASRYPESEAGVNAANSGLVEYRGMGDCFQTIRGHHALVFEALRSAVRNSQLGVLEHDFSCSVSIHVRLSDFALPGSSEELLSGTVNRRIPIAWYVKVLRNIRACAGKDVTAYVFSDGRDHELAELLGETNCHRLSFGSSIADLLALSRANALIASGSTFSMWASYLGRMPVVWHKGQMRQRLYDDPALEVELADGEPLPAGFCAAINHVMEGKRCG